MGNDAGTTALLAKALRQQAELEWDAHALRKPLDVVGAARVSEQLFAVREALQPQRGGLGPAAYAINRGIVENHPDVVALRIQANDVSARAADAPRHAEELAPIVRALIKARNACARPLGATDFAGLTLDSLGLSQGELCEWLAAVQRALGELIASEDKAARSQAGWSSYWEGIARRAIESDARIRWGSDTPPVLASSLGIERTGLLRDLRTHTAIPGWCHPVDRPNDVRLSLPSRAGTISLHTVLHELGHYLHYTLPVPRDWPLVAPPPVFDETLAALLDLMAFAADLPAPVRRLVVTPVAAAARSLHVAAQRKWALAALFELRAYQADGESLDQLWGDVVREAGFAQSLPGEWALDSFYVDDPVYRFSYVVGATWAAQEHGRIAPATIRRVAARIRELGAAGYRANWRLALGTEDSLPDVQALAGWAEGECG